MGIPWKVIFAFVGVFVAGAVFGGFFTAGRWAKTETHPNPVAGGPTPVPPGAQPNRANNANRAAAQTVTPELLRRLTTRLKLTDEQRDKIKPIVGRADEDMRFLRQENFRSTNRVLERMHADIAVILTEQQRAELELMKKDIQDRMDKAEKERRDEARARKALQSTSPGRSNANDAAATATPPAPKGN